MPFASLAKVDIHLGVLQVLQKWIVAVKCSQNEHLDLAANFIFSQSENLDDYLLSHLSHIFTL